MEQYKKLNNIVGWAVFAFALVVYTLTLESTASLWDCGEFISGAFKLQIVHPPGAPLFLMLGRLFTLLSFGNEQMVAWWVNFMSGLASAFSVLFFFWATTALMRKIVLKEAKDYIQSNIVLVVGAAAISAASITFLDSLWFSAVEGEVYALSLFFLAFVFWAAFKWDAAETKESAAKWMLLIAFGLGVSVGVHLLSLLVVPVIALMVYFKHFKPSLKGLLLAGITGFGVLFFIMKVVISGTLGFASSMELFMVNTIGLGMGSGVAIALTLLVVALIAAIVITHKRKLELYHQIALAITFLFIGFSTYFMVPIRAQANPPINMNKPDNIFSLTSYVNREQYGDRPLLFGPNYTATQYDIQEVKKAGERYAPQNGKYVKVADKLSYEWKDHVKSFFPRMGFWQEARHKNGYRAWLNPGYNVVDRLNEDKVIKRFAPGGLQQANATVKQMNQQAPNRYTVKDDISFGTNIKYFVKYHLGFMYMRYFMWNFTGRYNELQGHYGNDDGRWISGISFIDDMITTSGSPTFKQVHATESIQQNKAHNTFYFLPFILGIIGMVYHFKKSRRGFFIILSLLLMVGPVLLLNSNEPPIEPRERDYVLAASFAAFAMWIGFGVLALYQFLVTRTKRNISPILPIVLCAVVPFIMGFEGWDDHNRNGRFTTIDYATNYLESCAPNSIIFTQGDNDTYPLWYAQEVEGVRTDVRIINLSLLGVDWYSDQLRYSTNESKNFDLILAKEKLQGDKRNFIRYVGNRLDQTKAYDLKTIVGFMGNDDAKAKITSRNGSENFLPTKQVYVDVDPNGVLYKDAIASEPNASILPRLEWTIKKGTLYKGDLILLDIIASNVNTRPIYFATSVSKNAFLGMEKFVRLEGMAYRVMPIINPSRDIQNSRIHTALAYDNVMNKFKWGMADVKDVHIDENTKRIAHSVRASILRLAQGLTREKQYDKTIEILDLCLAKLPAKTVPIQSFMYEIPRMYYEAGSKEKAEESSRLLLDYATDQLDYYTKQPAETGMSIQHPLVQENLFVIQRIGQLAKQYGSDAMAKETDELMQVYQLALQAI